MGKVLYMRKGDKHTKPGSRLPYGFTELAYIQSSGTQHVDTLFKPNQDTSIVIDCDFLESNTGSDHHIASVNNTSQYYALRAKSDRSCFQVRYNTDALVALSSASLYGRHTFKRDKNKTSIDGGTETVSTYGAFQITNTLPLFCYKGASGTTSGYASLKLYSCQIYDNDTLVRDFVPCITDDGEIGLYDLVGKKFYGNAGTGTFGAGDVVEYSLPEGYTKLAYIESTGGQYCDSGIKGSQNTRIEADYSTTATVGAIIGADSKWGSNMCTIEVHFAAFATSNYSHTTVPSGRHTVSLNKGVFSLDGAVLSTMTGTFTTPVNMTLFALNRNGAKQEYGSIKLYSMRIYESDACVRWYVPVITSAGAVGLWDVISRAFFGNAGTGAFIGSEVAA